MGQVVGDPTGVEPLDAIPVDAVTRYESEMLNWMRSEHSGLLGDIRASGDLSDDNRAKLKEALDAFAKQFA